jgi:hypothetical protein
MRRTGMLLALTLVAAPGCKPEREGESFPGRLPGPSMMIESAPEHLQGRVALPAGARVYARPTYASPSWTVRLPDPPAIASDSPARTRAFRVVGVVHSGNSMTPEFLAITNDLDGEDQDAPRGCGSRFVDLEHLRLLLYVPVVHVAEVTTRTLELEPFSAAGDRENLQVGAGARVGRRSPSGGLPPAPSGSSWRWIDADGIRVLAPVPDDAVGQAWNPRQTPVLRNGGERLLQDAEGSQLWLRDEGGSEVELGVRNDCGEHRRLVVEAWEVESLRALALEVFYDQAPHESQPVVQPDADYVIAAGTPLRWPDGELAGEVLADWGVSVGIGQDWEGRRCFPLLLSGELAPFEDPGLACVGPEALTPLSGGDHFSTVDELELGGSIQLGPPEVLAGQWTASGLRPLLNHHHATVAECMRPLLGGEEPVIASRWVLMLIASADGRVSEVEVTPLGDTHVAVEDCLRAEAFTWLMPEPGGQVLVPVTLGAWDASLEAAPEPEPEPEPEPKGKTKTKGKAKAKPEPEPERGKVVIIRDDEPEPAPEEEQVLIIRDDEPELADE